MAHALKIFFGFMLLEAVLIGGGCSLFAKPETAHFLRNSPWMLLYYAPFAALVAWAEYDRAHPTRGE